MNAIKAAIGPGGYDLHISDSSYTGYSTRELKGFLQNFNLFYSYTDNKVYLVEPQNDVFYLFDNTKWRPWMVII